MCVRTLMRFTSFECSNDFRCTVHCGDDETECEGVTGIEMLVINDQVTFSAEMRRRATAVYTYTSNSWN